MCTPVRDHLSSPHTPIACEAMNLAGFAPHDPSILVVVRYATERDISVGLYLTAGTQTCVCSKAGSLDHEREDAATLSRWNVSTIKYEGGASGADTRRWAARRETGG